MFTLLEFCFCFVCVCVEFRGEVLADFFYFIFLSRFKPENCRYYKSLSLCLFNCHLGRSGRGRAELEGGEGGCFIKFLSVPTSKA